MKELINNKITISSREVAEMMEVKHKHLLEKIDNINKTLTSRKIDPLKYWTESSYKDAKGEARREFQVTKRGCEFLAHKSTGEKGIIFTDRYMDRFEEMENLLKETLSYMIDDKIERAKRWIKEEETRIRLEEENKSLIRENTYLKNENDKLKISHNNDLMINDVKQMINHVIRTIGYKMYHKNYMLAWEAFYRFVNYELDTNINKRKGSGLERFSEKELRKMLIISIKWARVNNIEVNNGLSNIQISSEELNSIKIF